MRHRLWLLVTGALAIAACGQGETAPEAADVTTAATQAPATSGSSVTPTTAEAAPMTTDSPSPTTSAPATDPRATEPPAAAAAPSTSAPATAAPTTEPPLPEPAWPDDGCSADNSPTPTDVADGPLPQLEVRAASADSPLPDLAVRRINCAGGWVNLRNELPADRALLVWFWAPH